MIQERGDVILVAAPHHPWRGYQPGLFTTAGDIA
jgi:hypothetical protein